MCNVVFISMKGDVLVISNLETHLAFIDSQESNWKGGIKDSKVKSARIMEASLHTHPLLNPCVVRTVISKEAKSSMVTASKATSKRTKDHSKTAYWEYAVTEYMNISKGLSHNISGAN